MSTKSTIFHNNKLHFYKDVFDEESVYLDLYDIEDNEDLISLYNELENIEGVTYNKTISQTDLIKELNKSLLFIYPTNMTETFCNSMIEAMSCGCYVISNNIGALKEVANPYGYFLDIEVKKDQIPPYDNFITNEYLNEIVIIASNIIDSFLIKSPILEQHLVNQINYIKNKYKWNNNIFN